MSNFMFMSTFYIFQTICVIFSQYTISNIDLSTPIVENPVEKVNNFYIYAHNFQL